MCTPSPHACSRPRSRARQRQKSAEEVAQGRAQPARKPTLQAEATSGTEEEGGDADDELSQMEGAQTPQTKARVDADAQTQTQTQRGREWSERRRGAGDVAEVDGPVAALDGVPVFVFVMV